MKNYLIEPNGSKNFILNYTVEDNTIMVDFAGEKFPVPIPYTIENEQVESQEKRFNEAKKWLIY